jgi:hypothetical protein
MTAATAAATAARVPTTVHANDELFVVLLDPWWLVNVATAIAIVTMTAAVIATPVIHLLRLRSRVTLSVLRERASPECLLSLEPCEAFSF